MVSGRAWCLRRDERLKLLVAALGGALPLYGVAWQTQAAMLVLALGLCLACSVWRLLLYIGGVVLVLAAGHAVTMLAHGAPVNVFTPGPYFLVLKLGPMVAFFVFASVCIKPRVFVRLLAHHRLPLQVTLPLAVALRFLPTVVDEMRQIRDAARTRGIAPQGWRVLRHPIRTLDHYLMPLILRALTISEDLARSAIARGIQAPGPKVPHQQVQFGLMDGVVLVMWLLFCVAWLVADDRLYAARAGML